MDYLIYAGLYLELMIGACTTAFSISSSLSIVVVKDKEGRPAEFIDVEVGSSQIAELLVIVDRHEEYTIVLFHRPCFFSQLVCPLIGSVGKGSVVIFLTPRISDLNESDRRVVLCGKCLCPQDRVGVAQS